MLDGSDVDVEAEVDVAGGLAAADAPVRPRRLPQQDRDVVPGYAQRLETVDDLAVQRALGLDRAALEGVDADLSEELGPVEPGRDGESVRRVRDQPHVAVARRDPERTPQRVV